MKKSIIVFVLCFIIITVYSQTNEIDIRKIKEEIDIYGIPTITSVEQMKINAETLYSNKKWNEAANAYALYAKDCYWLSKLISKGFEPYYSASEYDKKSSSYYELKKILVKYEVKADYFKKEINIAVLRQGICYYKLESYKESLPYIIKALELLSYNEKQEWEEARNILYEIIMYK